MFLFINALFLAFFKFEKGHLTSSNLCCLHLLKFVKILQLLLITAINAVVFHLSVYRLLSIRLLSNIF